MRSYIALALAAFASANETKARFMQFITEFGKTTEQLRNSNSV